MNQPDLFDRAPFADQARDGTKFTRSGSSIVPPLFDEIVRARLTDPPTSHAAARAVQKFAGGHAKRILAALKLGPATVDELAQRTGLQPQQINKRLPELEAAGSAKPTGALRRSTSGHPERVWTVL